MAELTKREGDIDIVKTVVVVHIDVRMAFHGAPSTLALPPQAQTFDPSMRAEDAIASLLEQAAEHLRQSAYFTQPMTAADIGRST